MAANMNKAGGDKSAERVLRFDKVQRATHWSTAILFFVLVVTGAALYVPAVGGAIGHRLIVEDLHVYCGIAIVVPLIMSVLGPWGQAMRRDLASMNRFTRGEMAWLRTRGKQGRAEVGKFNPGQKLNTFAVGGFLTVMLATGLILRFGNFLPVSYRTSATFVHDWFAFAVAALILAHISMAIAHPGALRSMFVGWVTSPRPGVSRQKRAQALSRAGLARAGEPSPTTATKAARRASSVGWRPPTR
jgi:formate dehydrogenase subunit gamma